VHRRLGFTLIETLIVIVVIGLLTMIAIPRMTAALAQSNVRAVGSRVAAVYSAARTVAVSTGRTATVHVSGNKLWAVAGPPRMKAPIGANTLDTIVLPENLMTSSHVALTPSSPSFSISPSGLGQIATDITVTASKDGHSSTVTIKPYGRVIR
jgi:type II secretion system protein H